ncbi:lipase family protein [Fluviicola chungangensis]|uniref:Lipase family protein n=1 Tax=Fluviicola chungangensis TaxID=2597671 RepID=A0A556N0R8_9FLAO|nr:lipase family protein [Fluviicola chungangensis]TSJ45794.1 lipase family protein [Fluviicola chungangensis]
MNKLLTVLITLLCMDSYAQHSSGFDAKEARDLIQICNSFTYLDLEGSDEAILPKEYVRIYSSPAYGMDNLFQVYVNQSKTKAVLNFRGSTDKKSSWLENMYSSLVPAKDTIFKGETTFSYTCAEDPDAAVHAGYILGLSYCADDILKQIQNLNKQGIYTIYITGHSQGGALAQMARSWLHFLPKSTLSSRNSFKVYAFANPMIGNKVFAMEYQRRFADPGYSFLLHNPEDIVPKMPVSFNDSTFWKSNLQTMLFDRENFHFKESMKEGMLNMFGAKLNKFNNGVSNNVHEQLVKLLGDFRMPAAKNEANFMHTSKAILLPPTQYPLELKDSSILQNDSLMKVYKRGADGMFEDKSVYKRDKAILQHKPYNYYTALLKVYFIQEYDRLENKYFILPKK